MSRVEGEQKYFTAQEARAVSKEVSSQMMNNELNWVYEKINNARFSGDTSVTFYNKDLMKSTKEFLKNKGFDISHFYGDQRDPANDITISW